MSVDVTEGVCPVKLSQADYRVLQLALDVLSTDTARRQKAALKRRDETGLARLHALGDDMIAARRRLFELLARLPRTGASKPKRAS